jgi:hypothetical protein
MLILAGIGPGVQTEFHSKAREVLGRAMNLAAVPIGLPETKKTRLL